MNRRSLFATLLAPLLAPFVPKGITLSELAGRAGIRFMEPAILPGYVTQFIQQKMELAQALMTQQLAAAKYAPKLEDAIGEAMLLSVAQEPKLPGRTLLVVDTSGSMQGALGGKTEMSRLDAAAGLSILVREVCEFPVIYATAGNDFSRIHATMELPARRGFALSDVIKAATSKIGGGGIFLVQCLDFIAEHEKSPFDRVIVFTDEQDCDQKANPASAKKLGKINYVVNVATNQNGISYRDGWEHVDGWSEHVIDYIREIELLEQQPQ